ncbi:hypothetical protein RN001_015157 [Aquatica leii]|uniref:DUF7869 domain-containing protein n=1 Tax=Aquatica leii TaxID=1421715 RepID=A0AAN7P1F4_9COLE|nr:hypothetical protein RN001_015157 [Aquatica leii]
MSNNRSKLILSLALNSTEQAITKAVYDDDDENIPLIQLQSIQLTSNQAAQNPNTTDEPVVDNDVCYTKAGTIRKRKKYDTDLKTRNSLKLRKLAEDHTVLPGCTTSCKKKCPSRISEQTRTNINTEFWKLSNKERRTYLLNTCKRLQVKRRTCENSSRKQNTFKYFMTNDVNGEVVEVCKTNDRVLHDTLSKTPKGQLVALPHARQGNHSNRKIDDETIIAHIESFNPCVSHYRREHSPNIRYLSSDITVTIMYKDFIEKYPNTKLSYETYRKKIKQRGISFAKLGHEECDVCESFRLHEHDENNIVDSCVTCGSWKQHITRANDSRQLYKKHSESSIDMFKCVIFMKRLIAYNETFVPVGKFSAKRKPYAVVWHEAISKRSKEDLISTFYAFFKWHRDATNIIIWLDNCGSQNKNWTLFTFLIRIINSEEISAKSIILNYFEPGHTFMSADSFHHQVELSMKKKQKIYDFDDFSDAVGSACKGNVEVKKMEHNDFYKWKNLTSQQKLKQSSNNNRPYLSDIVQIMAERGKFTLQYKNHFNEESTKTLDFLMKKAMKKKEILRSVNCLERPHGFPKEKKESILKQLDNLLPENRKLFWKNLPTTTSNEELRESFEEL